jgi:hypothetical protein
MSKPSTPELESRLRTTLRDVQTADLTAVVSSRRSEGSRGPGRNAARFAAVALVAVTVVGSVSAWRSQRQEPAKVQLLAGSENFDTLLMVDSMRGPLERQLGTAFGDPNTALFNAVATAEQGCATTASYLMRTYLDSAWRTMTVRDYVETHGTGMLEPQASGSCGLPKRPVPSGVRTLQNKLGKLLNTTNECVGRIAPVMESLQQALADHDTAIYDGTYPGLAKIRLIDKNVAYELHRCQAIENERLQPAITGFLADPENRRLMDEAAAFIKELGLSVE